MKRLQEVLNGQEENYILPFFWQRGEEESVLREEMERIHESGIRAVCVEARPHPDFLGPQWWQDFDAIMDEARKRDMKVWVLDDEHFPTGSAVGKVKEAPKELRRSFLSERHIDALGPAPYASFIIEVPKTPFLTELGEAETVAIIANKRNPKNGELIDEAIDLSELVRDGVLHWNVPEGYWRIFVMTISDKGGSKQHEDYLNPLVAESTRILIDTVHEAFYERYQADFGKIFSGFFSDEPGFYNDKDPYDFRSLPGKKELALPWSKGVHTQLKELLGEEYAIQLPLLWHDKGTNPPSIRYHYMNIVSRLYAENFTTQIGNWCREHGVEYIGHVIEDNNVHARLGAGAGHFFRALGGQDMSGIDVVLWQLNPGFDEIPVKWLAGEADSEFFNYGLGKMASSLAHHDPKKKGRTMAEVFGAYGWVEGLKLMKWLTDHMLVRGVNQFVPHSFSAREFPDPDCPPHLYARGKNPQFRYYQYLNHYTNRLSHLLSDGTHVATAAVLYHAEAEWSGKSMYFHKPVKELLRRQIDCDVLPFDLIMGSVTVEEGKLKSGNETFDCFIIPFSEALPAKGLARIVELAEQGLPVMFIDALPERASEGDDISELIERIADNENVAVVPLAESADHLVSRGFYELKTEGEYPYLRHYHIRHEDADVYFFFNEHPQHLIDTMIELPISDRICLYDAYDNRITRVIDINEGDNARIPLRLEPFETVVAATGGEMLKELIVQDETISGDARMEISTSWLLSTAASEQYPSFELYGELEKLVDVSRHEYLPRFSGTLRYETTVEWNTALPNKAWLDLGEVYETAEVFINGCSAGVKISHPYRFDISAMLQQGTNTIVIEVTNTLVKQQRDIFSMVAQQEPSGLLGPIYILY